jgi:hypothetical protein
MAYTCRSCGESHGDLPPSVGFDAPEAWLAVPEAERERRGECSTDSCVLDGEHFFILGCLEIPVLGGPGPFVWNAWSSLSRRNFERAVDLWTTTGRESEPPYFGWLSSRIPGYPETLNLKCRVHTRPVGERPKLELEPTEHPLAVHQRDGIPYERLREIVEAALHG